MGGDYLTKSSGKEFEKTLEIISEINFYLKNYKNEIKDLCDTKPNLKTEIQKFHIKYSKYERLERFSIPIIGKISSGKSTILNYILDLKESLQVKSKATTKFVCIIRHNESLKGQVPKLYTVKFNQRAELNDHYNFDKGELIQGNIKK